MVDDDYECVPRVREEEPRESVYSNSALVSLMKNRNDRKCVIKSNSCKKLRSEDTLIHGPFPSSISSAAGPGNYNWEKARDSNVSDNSNKYVLKFNL
jgi:hypothetical protein